MRPATTATGARCPSCSRYAGPDAQFCPHCGARLDRPASRAAAARSGPGQPVDVLVRREGRSAINRLLRTVLAVWLVAYPVLSCGPILIGASVGGGPGGGAVLAGVLAGGLLFWPWVVGVIVLGLLVLLTG